MLLTAPLAGWWTDRHDSAYVGLLRLCAILFIMAPSLTVLSGRPAVQAGVYALTSAAMLAAALAVTVGWPGPVPAMGWSCARFFCCTR